MLPTRCEPFAGVNAKLLHEMIEAAGIHIDFHSFVGTHTIDGPSVTETGQVLAELAS